MAPAFEHVPLHAHTHAHKYLSTRAELRGPCWNANAVLGAVQLAPHVRSLRLKSRGVPQQRPTLREITFLLS